MSDEALRTLAESAGLMLRWIDYRGEHHEVDAGTLRALLDTLEVPCATPAQIDDSLALLQAERAGAQPLIVATAGEPVRGAAAPATAGSLPYRLVYEDGSIVDGTATCEADGRLLFAPVDRIGYHRIEIGDTRFTLAVAPRRCYGVADAAPGRRLWGLTAQLYSLRRPGDGGIGDFSGLQAFAESAARHGADALAVSPMHALFSADLQRFSPYSPSSRLFLNALHVDPAQAFGAPPVAEAVAQAGLGAQRAALEAMDLIDWPAAARARLDLLKALFTRLPRQAALQDEFERYRAASGPALRDHARFEALHAHFLAQPHGKDHWSWRDWPSAYRDSQGTAVAQFAAENDEAVRFHAFLQWLAERGLAQAHQAARAAGMAVGLIGDLAVGTDGGGSHAWSRQHDLLIGASVGAPPDLINAVGQSWGLTTFSPRALRLHGYAPFLEMLRAQMRHIGGLRIDHVIGLGRLWLVPEGAKATQGAYLRYPLEDLFRLIALESWRHGAVIIGEDMGTVPEGFRGPLAEAGILGMRVLWFERDWGLFVEPQRWPEPVVAMTTTHDLPTVAGWWRGRDIEWRARLDLFGPHNDEPRDRAARDEDRVKLWDAFRYAGVAAGAMPALDAPAPVADAAAAFIAKTPSPLALLPAEDALAQVEQPNIPGTIDEHPNWRRRLPGEAATLLDAPAVAARLAAMDRQRRNPAQ